MATNRRLAAILAADVVGYSRLMERDETGTLARLKQCRKSLFEPTVAEHNGRIVKLMGDGVLVEFASIVDAVSCAAEFQTAITEHNAGVPPDDRIEFRIGLNLGDVIVEGDDIYGDGVNLAARLEELADPGGICVTRIVRDQVQNKLPYGFRSCGERRLKNIAQPVEIFALGAEPAARAAGTSGPGIFRRPAVAVLPFENLGEDQDQEYFSDGISEDIITGLSHWRWFPVIARNSSFAFRGRSLDTKRIAGELGARYVVDGSVRRAGGRVRISARLIDAESGHQIWAERYDREFEDILAVQDDIAEQIAAKIGPEVGRAEEWRAVHAQPSNLTAWDCILKARYEESRGGHGYGTREGNSRARGLLRRAIELDPESSQALSRLALCDWHDAIQGWADNVDDALASAHRTAREALVLDDGDWLAHLVVGITALFGRHEQEIAVEELERGVSLNPSAAMGYHMLGCALNFLGRPTEAIPWLEGVLKLDPRYRNATALRADFALSNLLLGNHDKAIVECRKAVAAQPDYVRGRQRLVAALAAAGEVAEAKSVLATVRRMQPGFSIAYVRATYPFKRSEHFELFADALRRAGLAE